VLPLYCWSPRVNGEYEQGFMGLTVLLIGVEGLRDRRNPVFF
jgi:hypothetical protein